MMDESWIGVPLQELGVLRIRGPDALRFLQGQLSADVTQLDPQHALLAGYHNPQGRAIAVLRLLQWEADDILAVASRESAAVSAARLSKYVLRAKVRIANETDQWTIRGFMDPCVGADGGREPPAQRPEQAAQPADIARQLPQVNSQCRLGSSLWVRLAAGRLLCVTPEAGAPAEGDTANADAGDGSNTDALRKWHALEIEAGEPQVVAATSEEFVAQMLNLDVLGAIAFDKGCYTGQEVIARAHYRGRVKRRMQRFRTHEAHMLQPGDGGQLDDGRSFKVVRAVRDVDGRCEFLAVTEVAHAAATLQQDSARDGAGARTAEPRAERVSAQELPLPYALP